MGLLDKLLPPKAVEGLITDASVRVSEALMKKLLKLPNSYAMAYSTRLLRRL